LSKIALKLGLAASGWRKIVADPGNDWVVTLCPQSVKDQYYGGEDGIELRERYGETPGLDCVYPGWHATRYNTSSHVYPILYWGGGY